MHNSKARSLYEVRMFMPTKEVGNAMFFMYRTQPYANYLNWGHKNDLKSVCESSAAFTTIHITSDHTDYKFLFNIYSRYTFGQKTHQFRFYLLMYVTQLSHLSG